MENRLFQAGRNIVIDRQPVAPPGRPAGPDLFGIPRGLMVLATTEMWERFSFYGMQALLLYMTKYLLLPEHARAVLGLTAFRSGLGSVVGPMTDPAFGTQTSGLYSGLIYGTPLIGAWVGDRVLGKTRTVTFGCLLMAAGHLAMASERLFLVAVLPIIVGAGGVIGNMAAQVGQPAARAPFHAAWPASSARARRMHATRLSNARASQFLSRDSHELPIACDHDVGVGPHGDFARHPRSASKGDQRIGQVGIGGGSQRFWVHRLSFQSRSSGSSPALS